MHRKETLIDYHYRINNVINYINNHLGEELDIGKLAAVSNFSVYHFHRIMRAYLNEPLWTFIMRLRIENGARLLQLTDEAVNEIAYKTGYETPAAFSNAFRKRFGCTPVEYRNEKTIVMTINYINEPQISITMKNPKIKEVKSMKVIFIQSIGEYGKQEMKNSWEKLVSFIKKNKLFSFGMDCLGISYDDPSITEPSKCRYEACVKIKKEATPEGEIGIKTIEGGKFAVFMHKGPYDKLGLIYNEIYRNWIPANKIEVRNEPPFEKYLNTPGRTKPENLKTEIYIPIV